MMRAAPIRSLPILLLFASIRCVGQHDTLPDGVDLSRCALCHSCKEPTHENPCLRPCERPPESATVTLSATAVPDVLVLGQLSELYVPVVFPHKIHMDMESMADGCNVCHHHNPPGRILACRECHGGPSNQENLKQPSLKGAYHRQCLSCHREWSHETDCNVCHVRRTAANEANLPGASDVSDIMGRLHPNISAPDKWVYSATEMSDGPVVSFHHQEHIQLFGLKCVDCHRKENCSRCHNGEPRDLKPRVREDPHEDCARCHDTSDNCALCHRRAETTGFNHATRTGFALKAYHAKLECSRCHLAPKQFAGLDPECESCHPAEWIPEPFDHALAGLILDETHVEVSCADCHTAGLGKPVTCGECHDDARAPLDKPPGKKP
ncbi:MAG: hypothetical protein GHCLOJNM_00035 [bacterium]|nr:hypothetical protein [bacterium]